MPALTRFLAPASRRSYSYFSSKAGGRYFNSAKPSKAPPAPTATTKDAAANVAEIKTQDATVKAAGEAQAASVSASSSSVSTSAPSPASTSGTTVAAASVSTPTSPATPSSIADLLSELNVQSTPVHHPTLSHKDVKLHQFFAMGRPLLLLGQPTSILRPVPAGAPLFSTVAHLDQQAQMHRQKNLEALGLGLGLDAPVDPFIDADAEAARQLTRALTMNKAAAALSWENTMRGLGLDVSKDADRVNLPQQFARDWEEILADSTKRKRRKKMKKHKLKKRRRATRHERLKLK